MSRYRLNSAGFCKAPKRSPPRSRAGIRASWRVPHCHSPLRKGTVRRAPGPTAPELEEKASRWRGVRRGGRWAVPSGLSRGMAGCYDGVSWDLLWLKVRELSRLPSGCNLACIIPCSVTGNRQCHRDFDHELWVPAPPGSPSMSEMG